MDLDEAWGTGQRRLSHGGWSPEGLWAGAGATPGSNWRPSAWVLSRYLWRFQLRLGLNISCAAALASSPTQKVSQEACKAEGWCGMGS